MRIQHNAVIPLAGAKHPAQWTEREHDDYNLWLEEYAAQAERNSQDLHPVVKELQDRIDNSTRLTQLAQGMYDEMATRPTPRDKKVPYYTNIKDYKEMIRNLNYLLTAPILWNSCRYLVDWTASPILSIVWRPLHTTCGFAFFQDPEVNIMMKQILNKWGEYLRSPESAWALDNGPLCFFGSEALAHLISEANVRNDRQFHTFEDIYVCDPSKPRYGFTSWDDFFTRSFREGVRPLADPDDNNVIVHACESTPVRVRHNVQYSQKFWTKGTPYSLKDMLGHDELSKHFVSGTVYQAYLNSLSYHRWHSPVSGKVVKATLIPGFYFSEPPTLGSGSPEHNRHREETLAWSNTYQTAVSTRALMFIEADNPAIGLMAALFVGLTEISTCEIAVKDGQRVQKGDEIGRFHCGGSTYCLIFRNGVELLGLPNPAESESEQRIFPVRSCLARVRTREERNVPASQQD